MLRVQVVAVLSVLAIRVGACSKSSPTALAPTPNAISSGLPAASVGRIVITPSPARVGEPISITIFFPEQIQKQVGQVTLNFGDDGDVMLTVETDLHGGTIETMHTYRASGTFPLTVTLYGDSGNAVKMLAPITVS